MASKRVRTANFSNEECFRLLAMVKNYAHVVESKKTDATTSREKMQAWESIAQEFNCGSLQPRSAVSLRLKFDVLKREARKLEETGGGPYEQPKSRHHEVLGEYLGMVSLSANGLPASYDSDVRVGETFASSTHALDYRGMNSDEADEDVLNDDETGMGDLYMPADSRDRGNEDDTGGMSAVAGDTPGSTPAEPSWKKDYGPAMLGRAKHPSLSQSSHGLLSHNENWKRRRIQALGRGQQITLSANTDKIYARLAIAKREVAELKKGAVVAKQEGEKELLDIKMQIEQARLEEALLDVEIKKGQLELIKFQVSNAKK